MPAYAGHVNPGLNQGATLPGPDGRLRGTGKAIRHIRHTAPADLADPAAVALVQAAAARANRLSEDAAPRAAVRPTTGAKRRPSPPAAGP